MSWNKLAPISKSSGKPMASASIAVDKHGAAKIGLLLAATLRDEFDCDACDVLAGSDDDFGLVRLEFRGDGAFKVGNFVHGGGRVFLPVPEGMPEKPTANAACQVVEKRVADGGLRLPDARDPEAPYLVIRLPVEEWRREIASRLGGGSGRAVAAAAVPPAPTVVAPPQGEGLDMVAYLKSKGLAAERLAGGRFQLNGNLMTAGGLLRQVNQHREAAELAPLTLAQVR